MFSIFVFFLLKLCVYLCTCVVYASDTITKEKKKKKKTSIGPTMREFAYLEQQKDTQ